MRTTNRLATAINVALGSALVLASSVALAQNAVRGKQLYENTNGAPLSCATATACHGLDPNQDLNKIKNGTSAAAIQAAIATVPVMNFLSAFLTSATDRADIAAYIVNPAAASLPTVTASGTSLTFGSTQVATNNSAPTPASITLTNSGAATLNITGIAVSGTNAADFTPTGTCVGAAVAVAPAATCTLSATFRPGAIGTRTATLTVQSNATANPAITLSGTGSAVPVPSVAFSRTSIAFSTQTVATASGAQQVTLTNSGSGPLTVTQVATMPTPEFASTSNCVGTVAAGANCTINVTFTPAAAGNRSGSLSITSNATGSPHAVALSGVAVTSPTGIASAASASVAFPNTAMGAAMPRQSTTITNTGNAVLQIASVAIGGPNATDFRLSSGNTCSTGTNVAVNANCRVEVEFQPQSVGAKSATVTVNHNGAGGVTTLAASGTVTATSSSAMAPSNVGGVGAVSGWQLAALALSLLLVPALRRRLARARL
jgi:hypothetical protein